MTIKHNIENARKLHHGKQVSGRTKDTGNLYVIGKLLKKSPKKVFSEDISGHVRNVAWVMDGATDVFHENTDLYVYMQELNANMYQVNHNQSLIGIISDAIDQTNHLVVPTDKLYTLSSFTFTIVRLTDKNTWEYILIGDSWLAYTDIETNNEVVLTDRRFREVSKVSQRLKRQGVPWIQVVQEERMLMNNQGKEAIHFLIDKGYPDGYWMGSADKRGLQHVLSGTIHAKSIVLYTDGVEDNPHMSTANPHKILSFESKIDDDQTLLILTN